MAKRLKQGRDAKEAAANDAKVCAAVDAVLAHAEQARIRLRQYGGRDA
jgi:hypothetical protein